MPHAEHPCSPITSWETDIIGTILGPLQTCAHWEKKSNKKTLHVLNTNSSIEQKESRIEIAPEWTFPRFLQGALGLLYMLCWPVFVNLGCSCFLYGANLGNLVSSFSLFRSVLANSYFCGPPPIPVPSHIRRKVCILASDSASLVWGEDWVCPWDAWAAPLAWSPVALPFSLTTDGRAPQQSWLLW